MALVAWVAGPPLAVVVHEVGLLIVVLVLAAEVLHVEVRHGLGDADAGEERARASGGKCRRSTWRRTSKWHSSGSASSDGSSLRFCRLGAAAVTGSSANDANTRFRDRTPE